MNSCESPITWDALSNLTTLSKDFGFLHEIVFAAYLRGRHVLYVGSGANGLAIDAQLQKVGTYITSVNPLFRYREQFEQRQKDLIAGSDYYQSFSADKVEAARQAANQQTVAAYVHNLPFKDNSFDVVIPYQDRGGSINQFFCNQSLQEYIRVVRPGGRIRVRTANFDQEQRSSVERVLEEMGLPFCYNPAGVEIRKLR